MPADNYLADQLRALPSMPMHCQKGGLCDEPAAAAAGARGHTAAAFPSTAKAEAPFVLTSPLIAQAVNKSLAEVRQPPLLTACL